MSRYLLEIKLLSDMCVSDGGVYNSSVDVDICYDRYGFPYIPAKRIRGCLRECAIELRDWDMDIPWQKMFGTPGDSENRAAVRIGDAHLKGIGKQSGQEDEDGMRPESFEEMRALAGKNSGHIIFHPQNILNHFTYTRTQTSIDYETGVADKTTLRTMRVADKGLVFIARVDMESAYEEAFKKCCAVFRHIGISRTRGLGEITVSLTEPEHDENGKDIRADRKPDHAAYEQGAQILEYQLELEEPVICKSVNGGEARTLDYIEGSKMLGLVIGSAGSKEAFLRIMDGNSDPDKDPDTGFAKMCDHNRNELFCSNAYISQDGIRYTEVPAYICSVKNDSSHYINKLYPDPAIVKEEGLQINRMEHCYVHIDGEQKLYKKSVAMEERYHHRRPEDKSVGRAAAEESGNSQFYQISSIEAGQTFRGYFAGSGEQIKAVYDILAKQSVYYIGYGRSSEYGKVKLKITGMRKRPEPVTGKVKAFCVKLDAPAIVYNKNAFYSTDADDLIEEVNAALGIPEDMLEQADIRRYVRYTVLGGYNATWNCPKPVITAFDKGTSLLYTLKEEAEITFPSAFLIGERVSEGYGEATVQVVDAVERECSLLEIGDKQPGQGKGNVDVGESLFAYELCRDLFQNYVRLTAARDAKKGGFRSEARPTVSNMLFMCQENRKFEQVKYICDKRYGKNTDLKAKKLAYAGKILNRAESGAGEVLKDFCCKYQIENFKFDMDEVKKLYLESYLKQLKYNFRQESQRKGGGENGQQSK